MSLPPASFRALATALALCCAGCSCSPDDKPCTSSADCPDEQQCVDGACRAGAEPSDGGGGAEDGAGSVVEGGSPHSDGAPGDATCGGGTIAIDFVPPNVLLVFDRSCSMRRRVDTPSEFGTGPDDPTTRWYVAREAVGRLLDRYPGRVRWGLMAFPDPREGCAMPPEVEVSPAPMTRSAIATTLESSEIQPFGLCGPDNGDTMTQPRETPTEEALEEVLGVPALTTDVRDDFAILVTDGGVTCGATEESLADVASRLLGAGIPTAVIGFTTSDMEATLEAIAAAGGLARPGGSPSYYRADDGAELDAALDAIVVPAIPCSFGLEDVPPDPDALYVTVDDERLPRDDANGFTYDGGSNRITLNGEACRRLRAGEVRRIAVAFGCPPTACEPRSEICNGLDDDCDDAIDEGCLM